LTVRSLEEQLSRRTIDGFGGETTGGLGNKRWSFVESKMQRIEGIVREQGERLENLSEQVAGDKVRNLSGNCSAGKISRVFRKQSTGWSGRSNRKSASLREGFVSNTWIVLYGDLQSRKRRNWLCKLPRASLGAPFGFGWTD